MRFALLALVALGISASQPALADDMRFHEALSQPGIREQVDAIIGEQPGWVSFVLDRGGVEGPSITLTLEDQNYEYFPTCRPHECIMKRIGLLIGDDNSVYIRIFGTEVEDQIYGDPPAHVAVALAAQG